MQALKNVVFPKYIPTGNVELITPEIAQELIDNHNANNPRRKINRNVVSAYAVDMANGAWNLNGEPIVIDANGEIKNGQHRLLAVIAAGVPVFMYVLRGTDPSIVSYDHCFGRRINHELGVSSNTETLANIIVSDGYRYSSTSYGSVGRYINDHSEDIGEALRISSRGVNKSAIGCKRDVYGFIYLALRTGGDAVELSQFMEIVNSGFMLTDRASSSAIVLAKFLQSEKHTRRNRINCMTRMQFVANAYRDFCNGVDRRRNYTINNFDEVKNMLKRVRVMDGLEQG